eukprot:1964925-Prymnesium_polylepis.1
MPLRSLRASISSSSVKRVVAVDSIVETAARDGSKDRVLGEHPRIHRSALLVLRQRHEVLARVHAVDVRLLKDASRERVLLHAKPIDPLLQGALGDETVDLDLLLLTHPPGASYGLRVVYGIPRRVEHDHMVCTVERDADASRLGGDVHDTALVVELFDHLGTLVGSQVAVEEEAVANPLNRLERLHAVGEDENGVGGVDEPDAVDEGDGGIEFVRASSRLHAVVLHNRVDILLDLIARVRDAELVLGQNVLAQKLG